MNIALRRIAIVTALCGALACSEDEGGLEAVYNLFELNGQPMAYDPPSECCIYTGGSLSLLGGYYTASLTTQDKTSQMIAILTERGTYTLTGTMLAFQRISGGTYNFNLADGVVNGRVIRVSLGGTSPGAPDQYPAAFRR